MEKLKAKFRKGVLTIEIPKKETYVHYREIPVNGSEVVEGAQANAVGKGFWEKTKQKLRSTFRKIV